MPKLNPLTSGTSHRSGPELNSPGIATETTPGPAIPFGIQTAPMLPPSDLAPTPLGPISTLPPLGSQQSVQMNVGRFDDLAGFEFNFSDTGCTPIADGPLNCGPGQMGRLMPLRSRSTASKRINHNQESASALWSNGHPVWDNGQHAASHGIGIDDDAMGTGISGSAGSSDLANANTHSAAVPPGLLRDRTLAGESTGQMLNASNRGATEPVVLPEAKLAQGAAPSVAQQSNNGIIIHPPMLQPFNRNQHTFVIENQGGADAEDVVIEISIHQDGRIIAALPDNSVTTDKVSIFKFPKIVSGESVPVHVTAVSSNGSPIEFSASLISRAVYSFHTQQGKRQGKLSNVSYLNDQTLDSNPGSQASDGPVRVTNPFFGNQPRTTNQPQHPNQAVVPSRSRQR